MDTQSDDNKLPKQCLNDTTDCSYDKSEVMMNATVKIEGDEIPKVQRETRLTSIIEQLRGQNRLKGNTQRDNGDFFNNNGEPGGGGGATARLLCARDATVSPAHMPMPTTMPMMAPTPVPLLPSSSAYSLLIKSERLSPQESTRSPLRSVTPSSSSHPGTPTERGSPYAPNPLTLGYPKTCSEMMKYFAARHNGAPPNHDHYPTFNGFAIDASTPRLPGQNSRMLPDKYFDGLFCKVTRQIGEPQRLPAFPIHLNMSSSWSLLRPGRQAKSGRLRRNRSHLEGSGRHGGSRGFEHSPLDLSTAGETAAKRGRYSTSPTPTARTFNDDRSEERNECMCSETRKRIPEWSVDQVCDFVSTIDLCAEYVSNFREQRIDGAGLPLLTEDHLTGLLQMKLGPALKLKVAINKQMELCTQCQSNLSCSRSSPAAESATNALCRMNGNTTFKSEARSNTTSPS